MARPRVARENPLDRLNSWLRDNKMAQLFIAIGIFLFCFWWIITTVVKVCLNLVISSVLFLFLVMMIPAFRDAFLGQCFPKLTHILCASLLKVSEFLIAALLRGADILNNLNR